MRLGICHYHCARGRHPDNCLGIHLNMVMRAASDQRISLQQKRKLPLWKQLLITEIGTQAIQLSRALALKLWLRTQRFACRSARLDCRGSSGHGPTTRDIRKMPSREMRCSIMSCSIGLHVYYLFSSAVLGKLQVLATCPSPRTYRSCVFSSKEIIPPVRS